MYTVVVVPDLHLSGDCGEICAASGPVVIDIVQFERLEVIGFRNQADVFPVRMEFFKAQVRIERAHRGLRGRVLCRDLSSGACGGFFRSKTILTISSAAMKSDWPCGFLR